MMDVKPPLRPYRSPKRALQAAETRESVLSAARELFVSEGWTRATITRIALKAGVSNETIYATFGSKNALLEELVTRAVRGKAADVSLPEQEVPRRIAAETSQSRQIDLFAQDIASVLDRVAPLMEVARSAAGTDETIARLYAGFHRGRRKNLEWFASMLLNNGPIRDGMNARMAGEILWRIASPDLFLLMRDQEGVTQAAYAEWLAQSVKLLILAP